MSDPIRLAVLGGSGVATPELVDVLARSNERPAMHLALIGRDEGKLAIVGKMAQRLAEKSAPPITVSVHTDVRQGLEGARYILNQVRVGGYAGRIVDETFPHQFGIPGEETIGPGGMNMALRTIPVVVELSRIAEKAAPDALMINLTNPSSIVQYAIQKTTHVKVVSICDLPMMAEKMLADLLKIPESELACRYTGMNHFGWITGVHLRGQDMMPQVLDRMAEVQGSPVEMDIIRALGVIPTGYFKYIYHANRLLTDQQSRRSRAKDLLDLEAEILAAYQSNDKAEKPASLVKRNAVWYEHMIVPLLMAHINDTGARQYLQVRNGNALPFMPAEAIIEVPCLVRQDGFEAQPYDGGLPPDLEALLLTNATCEMLWAEAVLEHLYAKALRALLLNHLVRNYDQAKGILDKIWFK